MTLAAPSGDSELSTWSKLKIEFGSRQQVQSLQFERTYQV